MYDGYFPEVRIRTFFIEYSNVVLCHVFENSSVRMLYCLQTERNDMDSSNDVNTIQEVEEDKRKKKEKKKQNKTEVEKSDAEKGKEDKKDWSDESVSLLIDMLEENSCLWDVFHKDYAKRDLKEIAYSSIASVLDTTIASVKSKINSLRTQLGRERTKQCKTKSGQATDELYTSSWVHYERLAFLLPIIGASKSRDTLKRNNLSQNDSMESEPEVGVSNPKRKSIAEKKLDLLSKCTEALASNSKKNNEVNDPKTSAFSIYISEKLSQMNIRQRRIAEKRISDIIFEIEMATEREETSSNLSYGNLNNNNNNRSFLNMTPPMGGPSYMDMINH